MVRRLLAAVLFASLAWPTATALLHMSGTAASLRRMPLGERRARVVGETYRATMEVVRSVAPDEPLALMPRSDRIDERNAAVFFNYYAYARRTSTYVTLSQYAIATDRPKQIVGFRGGPHLTTYAALRAESMSATTVVRDMRASAEARREFVVPFVASSDGPPPDTYAVEAVFEADGRANVDATLNPAGKTRRFVVDRRLIIRDLCYEASGDMGLGWMRVRSDVPVRAAFWLVNRGTGASTPIKIVEALPPLPLRFPSRPDASLWLLNFDDESLYVLASGVGARIPPRAIIRMGAKELVESPRPLFAFLAAKKERGGTELIWPQ
jgi:hypothetical protein